jgi:hypothetical protein
MNTALQAGGEADDEGRRVDEGLLDAVAQGFDVGDVDD